MGNTIDWGQAAVNNTIGFGDGAENNTIGWGDIQADSWSPETNLTGTGGTPAFTNTLSTTFDGIDDYVDCGDNNNLSFGDGVNDSSFSLAFWVNLDVIPSAAGFFAKDYNATNREWTVGTFSSSGKIRFLIKSLGGGSQQSIDSTNFLSTNLWYHILCTYNGVGGNNAADGMKIYINGALETPTNIVKQTYVAMSNTIAPVTIGSYQLGGASPLGINGMVDETAVFNTELTQTNVTDIYNLGTPNDISAMSGLVSYWRMGDNDVYPIIKDVIGGNNGNMRNMIAANFVADVPPTPAWSNTLSTTFDGVDDLVSMGNVLTMASDGTDSFSVSLWFKTTSTQQYQQLIGKQNKGGSYEGWALQVFAGATQSQFRGFLGTVLGNARVTFQTSYSADVRSGNWNHVTMTYDGSQLASGFKVYLNGSSITVTAIINNTPADISNATDFLIGQRGTSSNYDLAFDGNIDEASYFNTELSQANVTDIYNLGTPNDISAMSGLVSYWRMGDNDTYPTITDNVGSNNGTMTNMSSANFVTDVPT